MKRYQSKFRDSSSAVLSTKKGLRFSADSVDSADAVNSVESNWPK